jgi:hypothetical protein
VKPYRESATLGQLWLRRDGAYLQARRMLTPALPWPLPEEREHELSSEQHEALAEYRRLDEQVRVQRHQLSASAGTRGA